MRDPVRVPLLKRGKHIPLRKLEPAVRALLTASIRRLGERTGRPWRIVRVWRTSRYRVLLTAGRDCRRALFHRPTQGDWRRA
jgi:hypothetical protein